MFHGLMNNPV